MNHIIKDFVLPCRAASIRGQLKHTYLTNKICLKTLAEDLYDSMLFKERGVPQHDIIRNLIAELLNAIDSVDRGYSPSQLLDQLTPFRDVAADIRAKMKEKVHQQFIRDFALAARRMRLEKVAKEFLATLDHFLSQDQPAKSSMENVQEMARALIRELESLPKGIWLWEPRRLI